MNSLKQIDDSLGIINDNDSKEWDNISNITDNDNNDDISTSPIFSKDNNTNNNDNNDNVDNEMILISLANDANALVETGDITQAILIYNDLVERYEIYYGSNHPSIIDFTMVLSDLYCSIGKFTDALLVKEKGFRLQQKLLGQDNTMYIDILNSLIWISYMAEDFRHVINFFNEMINLTRLFDVDNSEFAINMFNLLDQYESGNNVITIEQSISILEYITEIVFMFRGNHDGNTMIIKERLAYKLKVQAELVYQRYQSIIQSSEWTEDEIDEILLVTENNIINDEIDEVMGLCIPEIYVYMSERDNSNNDSTVSIGRDNVVDTIAVDLVEGVSLLTHIDTIKYDDFSDEKIKDQTSKIIKPYVRKNRTSLSDMQLILAEMKEKQIIPEDDNMFNGAFESVVPDISDANVDNSDDGDFRELLVVDKYVQGRVDVSGENYLYRVFPYEVSEAAQKYLFMNNFNPKYYGKTFSFGLFPPMIGEINGDRDLRYKQNFIVFSQMASSMRVKRLMLMGDIDNIKADMVKFKDMLVQVGKKKENRSHRIHLLEHELTEMIPEDPSLPHHRFNALLHVKEGWHIIISHIHRQYKRLMEDNEPQEKSEAPAETAANSNDEDIDTNLTLQDTIKAAYYIQLVQIIRTIEQYTRTGIKPEGKHHTQKQAKKKNSKEENKQEPSNDDTQNEKELKLLKIVEDKKLTFSLGQDAVITDFNAALTSIGSTPHPKKTLKSNLSDLYNFIIHDEMIVSNEVVSKPVLNELALCVYETQDTEEHSEFVAANLSKVADCLTKEIEKILITSLRMLATWPKMLEKYRKERLRRIGQKMTKIADDIEVDKQGSVRTIPNADEVMDTDIFHGAMQRMHINVIEPEAKKRIQLMKMKREEVKCELACLSQFFYSYVSKFTQKCCRGLIVRRRAYYERKTLVYQAMHAAASSIQAWMVAIKGKKKFAVFCTTLGDNVKLRASIKLQAFMRMRTKWHQYYLYTKDKKDIKIRWGVTKVQSVIRRYNARCRVLKMKTQNNEQLQQEVSEWGIVQIQKLVRGFIARKTIVRSLHIRNSIAPKVLGLAEKYLKKGNLWSFLKEIDFIMKHYQSDLNEMEKREDKYATTFVQKVLVQRQGQFDGAWNRFSKSALSHDRGSSTAMADSDGKLSAIALDSGNFEWADKDSSSNNGSKKGSSNTARTSTLAQSIPGPMLRRAVTATIKEGVKQEIKSSASDVSRSTKLANNIKKVYGSSSEVKVKKKTIKSKNSLSKSVSGTISIGSPMTNSPTRTVTNNNESNVMSANATSVDWVGAFENGTSNANNGTFKLSSVKKSHDNQRLFFSGESLLIDIPKGLNDSLERLFNAAAIRCYVPTFFADEDKEKAYSIYLQMPAGLPKLKYEQEAFKICQPILNQFNSIRLSKIQDVMPLSKFKTFMKNYKTPSLLLNNVVDIFCMLQKMGDFTEGKSHETSQQQNSLLQEDKATLAQTVSAIESNIIENMTFNDDDDYDNNSGSPTNQRKMINKKNEDVDPTVASRLLLSMVESGPWASLKASVEDLITHAAYVIVEHTRKIPYTNKFEAIETGHNAFKAHASELQLMSENEKKEAIKNRFRAALIMSTPFYLKLKAEGVLLVEDLLKVDFSSLNMPPMLQKQVEALLNVAVYSATNAKAAFTVRDHLSTNKETFTIPMLYDPKFQRSPFDPYGRQPRFNALQKLIKLRTKEENKKLKQDRQRKKETPKGLWENMNTEEDGRDGDDVKKKVKSFYNFKEVLQTQDNHNNERNHNESVNMSSIQSVSLNTNQDFNTSVQSYTSLESDTTKLVSPIIRAKSKQNTRIKYDRSNLENGTRPYICTEPNCGAAFSRLYTLKIHQKSHNLFANYHEFKRQPQLYLDPDSEDILLQKNKEFESSVSLSDAVLQELNNLEQGYGVDKNAIFPPIPYNFSRESNRSRNKSRSATKGSSRG